MSEALQEKPISLHISFDMFKKKIDQSYLKKIRL